MKWVKLWAKWWTVGTVATFAVAYVLYRRRKPVAAAAVVMISPFPWPGPEA
jgi:hypothetical protein